MSSTDRLDLHRRRLMQSIGATFLSGAVAAPMVIKSREAFAADNNLIVVSWGGEYQRFTEEAYVKPFEKETGIRVTLVNTPDLAKVKAQVTTNNVEWDVFDAPGPMALAGSKNGYWEPLDPALFKGNELIAPMRPDAVPAWGSTGCICWDDKKFPDGNHPETFAQYFDFEKFPGPRTLRFRASETLEIALVADGVPPDRLYPLDVDRAFRSLARIKPHVSNWVEPTPQTASLLVSGQVNFTYTYATLAFQTQKTKETVRPSFKQNTFLYGYFTVLKNAPNKANAMKYLQFVLRPDRQAAFANADPGMTPSNRAAAQFLTPDARKWQPNPDNKLNISINDEWWADHFEELTVRFKEWVLS
ncbi:ABC transporter substrate-binding protein [Bradyrhizobium sp. NAS96.2]|uniref:ABC transporter substrate-binding protein n=1 Tax=Bradyrhizobium sp. NAS96.2 TaxID=1680160 RepID=UPI00093C09EE|nr:ABC transporter substrate-binding protein [Bradyrhizobium sp. NAS96.2]OKO71457.1 spermidine/putrescine ABC transporter substrate-binding protein [Bradyrhizobium sp. NAS96.2]